MLEIIGQVINGYHIKSLLGSGGQSAVYLASHDKFDGDVAVRGTLPEFSQDSETVQRFQMEAVIFFRLKHPHIVPLLDYWRDDSGTWIVQKYMPGGSLRDKIDEPADMNLESIAQMLDQISPAIDHTHAHKIIHRDLKPDNILFDDKGVAYVHDFGVAKRLKSTAITRADVMIGSPAYFSPEQIQKRSVTPQTDVYIMGITLFEAIAGKHPFIGDVHTKMQLILKHLQSPLPPMSSYRANIPKAIEDVLKQATDKNPKNRYSTMTELAKAFREAMRITV